MLSVFFHYFTIISPMKRCIHSSLKKEIESPVHKDALYQEFGCYWPSGSKKEVENLRSLQKDRLMDGHMVSKQVIKEAPLSFQTKKVNKNPCPLLQIFKTTNIKSMVPRLNKCLPPEDQAQAMPLRMENCSHQHTTIPGTEGRTHPQTNQWTG